MRLLEQSCEQAKEFAVLVAVDGADALNTQERDFFETHIAECAECAAFYNDMQADLTSISLELKNLPEVEVPAGLLSSAMEKIRNQASETLPDASLTPKRNPIFMFARRFSAAAAAVVVLVLFSTMVVDMGSWFRQEPEIGMENYFANEHPGTRGMPPATADGYTFITPVRPTGLMLPDARLVLEVASLSEAINAIGLFEEIHQIVAENKLLVNIPAEHFSQFARMLSSVGEIAPGGEFAEAGQVNDGQRILLVEIWLIEVE
jgi:hypothetical protein